MQAQRSSEAATTVAMRSLAWSISASSPNMSPGPSVPRSSPAMLTVAVPSRIMKKPTPRRPSSAILCPALNAALVEVAGELLAVAPAQPGEQRHFTEVVSADGHARSSHPPRLPVN